MANDPGLQQDSPNNFHVLMVLSDNWRCLRGILLHAQLIFWHKGCGGCSISLHTICSQPIYDLLAMCDGHGPCFSITQDFHAQNMSNFAFTPVFESRQHLFTHQCFHDISNCEHMQVINPGEDDAHTILSNEQSTITVAACKIKIM